MLAPGLLKVKPGWRGGEFNCPLTFGEAVLTAALVFPTPQLKCGALAPPGAKRPKYVSKHFKNRVYFFMVYTLMDNKNDVIKCHRIIKTSFYYP